MWQLLWGYKLVRMRAKSNMHRMKGKKMERT